VCSGLGFRVLGLDGGLRVWDGVELLICATAVLLYNGSESRGE